MSNKTEAVHRERSDDMKPTTQRLTVVLGDQLSLKNPAIVRACLSDDVIFMAEVREESTHVWSHKARTAMFFSAMRHFAQTLIAAGYRVEYAAIGTHRFTTLSEIWRDAIARHAPSSVIACETGDWRVEQSLITTCNDVKVALIIEPDTHFLISRDDFAKWAGGKPAGSKPKQLRMETFYRHMRTRSGVLMRDDDSPEGGVWNFDAQNRGSFGKAGPTDVPKPALFAPDDITRGVFSDIEEHFPDHPGLIENFAWPVTRDQALQSLASFVRDRLPSFGQFQDAMWTDEPFLHHSLLSAAMNLKLLDPREVIDAVLQEYKAERADLASVEGFIRQILGWREFMRGVYWLDMPGMAEANHLKAETPLPKWYWTGETQMNCMRQAIKQTLDHGYAHHIQRLMVTGNFALIAGIIPQEVCAWYLAVYVDAIEWVELPNTAGMALYANGGRFTTKPYAASGAYIKRMSNYCSGCRYKPEVKTGAQACPMTTFSWDFLLRNEVEMSRNQRAALMMQHVAKLDDASRDAIRAQASRYLADIESL
jgi:deoxyribodipyrimidine photolyase-related protein